MSFVSYVLVIVSRYVNMYYIPFLITHVAFPYVVIVICDYAYRLICGYVIFVSSQCSYADMRICCLVIYMFFILGNILILFRASMSILAYADMCLYPDAFMLACFMSLCRYGGMTVWLVAMCCVLYDE